jgi:transposase-like protein
MQPLSVVEPYVPRKSSRRDPWTPDEAREALAAASRSGLTLAAFARRHVLSDRQLYWWHMRLRTHPDVAAGPLSFVPVVQAPARADEGASGVEVEVGGAVVRVRRDFCGQTLARTVAVLRGLPC